MAYVVIMCQGGFGMNTEAAESGRPHVDGDGNGVWLSGRHLLLVGRGSQGIDDHKHHDFGGEQGNDDLLAQGRFKDIHLGRLG